ncbi:hypothetical protein [Polaromonas sp.]|uniref:hypothetical protein n=1 Tax=Polaromonas sp. TaxID=1869339 RepID=UPI00352A3A0C
MKGVINIEVVRGTKAFGEACAVAAASIALLTCANAAVAPTMPSAPAKTAVDRVVTAETPAATKLKTLLADQTTAAQPVSFEQAQTLKYGIYPPVKTTVQIGGKKETHWTLHPFDLVRLSREAAVGASKVEGIRVSPERVGAIMISESSMVARTGWSSNGKTPSYGLGQLEQNTANALGVVNPNDPQQSAMAIARLLAQAQRFANANRGVNEQIAVSLAYNTSTTTRNMLVRHYGAALTLDKLPLPTQHHVKNMMYGERLMATFSRLSDQHEKVVVTEQFSASQQSQQTKELSMNTSSHPAPSTRSLITSLSTDHGNKVRLEHNQKMLEKAGHLQPVPMTSKGLETMRAAISSQIQRVTDANPAQMAAASLLTKAGDQVAKLAASMQSKAAATFGAIQQSLDAKNQLAGPDKAATTAVMTKAKEGGFSMFALGKEAMQLQRQLRAQMRDQQRPA